MLLFGGPKVRLITVVLVGRWSLEVSMKYSRWVDAAHGHHQVASVVSDQTTIGRRRLGYLTGALAAISTTTTTAAPKAGETREGRRE